MISESLWDGNGDVPSFSERGDYCVTVGPSRDQEFVYHWPAEGDACPSGAFPDQKAHEIRAWGSWEGDPECVAAWVGEGLEGQG